MKLFKSKTQSATESYLADIDITIGMVLSLGADGLVSNTTKPEFIAISDTKAGEYALVLRIDADNIYSSKKPTGAIAVGTAYTIDAKGEMTATATAGIFKVVEIKENAVVGTINL